MPIFRTRTGGVLIPEPGRTVIDIGGISVEYTGQIPTQADLDAYFAPPPDPRPQKGQASGDSIPQLRTDVDAIWQALEDAGIVQP